MGKGIVKLGDSKWATKDGNLLAYKETNNRFTNTEFTFARGTDATYVGEDGLIKQFSSTLDNVIENGDFSEIGSDLLESENGDFTNGLTDWTTQIPSGQTVEVTDNQLHVDYDSGGTTGSTGVYQNILTVGKSYKVVIDVAEVTGTCKIQAGAEVHTITSSGIKTFYTNNAANHSFFITRYSNGTSTEFTINSVSVKQLDPDDDWTVSGACEIIPYGQSYAGREGLAKVTITDDATSSRVTQSFDYTSGKNYLISVDVYIVSGSFRIDGSNSWFVGETTSDVISSDTTGVWQTLTGIGVALQTGTDDIWLRSLTEAAEFYVDNVSIKDLTPIEDTPRIDFLDDTDGHLLLEPSSTNLIDNSSFQGVGTGIAPSLWGTFDTEFSSGGKDELNGFKIKFAATVDRGYIFRVITVSSQTYALSFYTHEVTTGILISDVVAIYGVTRSIDGYFEDGLNVGNIIIQSNKRYTLVFTVSSGTSATVRLGGGVNSNATFDFVLSKPQLEQQSYATSYIPTAGTTVTRDAETCDSAGTAQDFNSEEGVLYVEFAALANPTSQEIAVCISQGQVGENRMLIRMKTDGKIGMVLRVADATEATLDSVVLDQSVNHKVAVKWKVNDIALWIDGSEIDTEGAADVFAADTIDEVSFNQGNNSNFFYGNCKAIKVYKDSTIDLAALTT